MILTERQWQNVVGMMKSNPNTREVVIAKDNRGNARVTCHSHAKTTRRQLRGNVVDFPTERIRRSPEEEILEESALSLLWGACRTFLVEVGMILGVAEVLEEVEE